MNLIQFNSQQLAEFLVAPPTVSDVSFLDQAVPPAAVLQRSLALYSNSVAAIWALPYFVMQDQSVVGCCGFKHAPDQRNVEIGYNVAPEARGRGVASSAVALLCQIAFDSAAVDTVVALISPENGASINVVRKNYFSFKQEVVDTDLERLERWELAKI